MSFRKSKKLPYNWRQLTTEKLASKGIASTSDQVKDVVRGTITSEIIAMPILAAVVEVQKEYAQKMTRIQKLRKKIS